MKREKEAAQLVPQGWNYKNHMASIVFSLIGAASCKKTTTNNRCKEEESWMDDANQTGPVAALADTLCSVIAPYCGASSLSFSCLKGSVGYE